MIRRLLVLLVAAGLYFLAIGISKADIITEVGMGVKLPGTTSALMQPECHRAIIVETRPDTPSLDYLGAHCGGDNPVFVGWPVAWERQIGDRGLWKIRAGWFHYSQWFDGKKDGELHMDCACTTLTIQWKGLKK